MRFLDDCTMRPAMKDPAMVTGTARERRCGSQARSDVGAS
jgi:hypothetical protein